MTEEEHNEFWADVKRLDDELSELDITGKTRKGILLGGGIALELHRQKREREKNSDVVRMEVPGV